MKILKKEDRAEEVQTQFSVLNFLFLAIILFVLGSGFFIYNQIYTNHKNSEFTRTVVSVLPLPAGSVNGSVFMYKEAFAFDQLAEVEYPDEDHFGYAIDAIVRQKLIEQIADELDVGIDSIEVGEDQWSQYNWTQKQYEDYVLKPLALASAVDEAIYLSSDHQQSVFLEVEHVLSLFESGISFEELAVQYSEVASSQFEGDVGYICIDELYEDLEIDPSSSVGPSDPSTGSGSADWWNEIGVVSGVIELEDSYAIKAIYDIIESEGEGVCTQVGLQMIVMYKNTLTDVLAGYKETAVVEIYGE